MARGRKRSQGETGGDALGTPGWTHAHRRHSHLPATQPPPHSRHKRISLRNDVFLVCVLFRVFDCCERRKSDPLAFGVAGATHTHTPPHPQQTTPLELGQPLNSHTRTPTTRSPRARPPAESATALASRRPSTSLRSPAADTLRFSLHAPPQLPPAMSLPVAPAPLSPTRKAQLSSAATPLLQTYPNATGHRGGHTANANEEAQTTANKAYSRMLGSASQNNAQGNNTERAEGETKGRSRLLPLSLVLVCSRRRVRVDAVSSCGYNHQTTDEQQAEICRAWTDCAQSVRAQTQARGHRRAPGARTEPTPHFVSHSFSSLSLVLLCLSNMIIFKNTANAGVMTKAVSLFPGLGFAAGYKILQRTYKFGGQPFVNDQINSLCGGWFKRTFGEKSGRSLMQATAGSLIGVGEVLLLPLDVLKIKAQTNPAAFGNHKGLGMAKLLWTEGRSLYAGAGATMMRNAPGSFALFGGAEGQTRKQRVSSARPQRACIADLSLTLLFLSLRLSCLSILLSLAGSSRCQRVSAPRRQRVWLRGVHRLQRPPGHDQDAHSVPAFRRTQSGGRYERVQRSHET